MGFWDKKLGNAGPAPRPAFDPGIMPGRQPQYQQPPQYQAPVQQGPDASYEGFVPNTTDPTKMSDVLPIWGYHGNPKGGAGETAVLGNCPNCSSPRFFSRRDGGVFNSNTGQHVAPAPECFECGFPRIQGALGVSLPAQAAVGPTSAARQGYAPPPQGVLGSLGQA